MLYDDNVSADVAAIVNLHREGPTATASVISAWRAVTAAASRGVAADLVLVLDNADDATEQFAESWRSRGATIVSTNEGDLGAARNTAAARVDAEWLAFLDGDDLWSEDWLIRAHAAASAVGPTTAIDVFHPAINIIFGDHHSLLHHVSSTSPDFSWARFRLHNSWTALSFVRTTHVLSVPYPCNDLDRGFGYEDWSWNAEIIRRGGRHNVVADTCHFIRRQGQRTLLGQSQQSLRSPYPTPDLIRHLPPDELPGATTALSTLTATSDDLPNTHRRAEVQLSRSQLDAVRFAITIEPAIAETITAEGNPRYLPQNFNTHVTPAQRALESIDRAAATTTFSTAAELCSTSELLGALAPAERARVIADVLLDPAYQSKPRGESAQLDETFGFFPQLVSATR